MDKTQLKPTHPSSKVNVVQLTSTTNTSQEMWDRMKQDTKEQDQQKQQQQSIVVKTSMFEFHFEFGSKRPPRAPVNTEEEDEDCYCSEQEEDLDIEQDDDMSEKERQEETLSEGYVAEYEHSIVSEESYQDNTDSQLVKMIDTKQLPSATADAMETYENIGENIYIGSATGRSMAEESMPCECKYDPDLDDPSEACGDDNACINRMMFMECIAQDCPCGRLCRNRRFQLGQYARVDVIRTEKKGYGLRALTDLSSNSFIMEYIGEVITQNEFLHRTREYDAQGFKHYYFMTLKNDEVIDATRKGCLARFMNHSCRPNCVTQKWVIGKKMRIGIFTSRNIKAGEELTFDYKFERYGAVAQKCFCGEVNCKGFIGAAATNEHVEEEVLTDSDSSSEDDNEVNIEKIQPLQDMDRVQAFVKKMLNSVGKPKLVNKLLMRLKLTNPYNSYGRDILKMIIRLHGLRMLKFWLGEWKHNDTIVYKSLEVLEQLPLANRNGLEDCKLLDVVDRFTKHENEKISQLATDLLNKWKELKSVYRIPKRPHVEMTDNNHGSLITDTIDVTDHIAMGITPILEDTTIIAAPNDIITTASAEGNNVFSSEKKETSPKKKIRFESTRELFDPDDDYYEYIPINTTIEELARIMKYPTLPSDIPTGLTKNNVTTVNSQNNLYDYYNYYYYYYNYNYYCPTQEQSSLPVNWQLIMNEDGSGYYYNTLTQQAQWELPQEDQAHVVPPTSSPPPFPLPPPPPPVLSPPPPPPPPPSHPPLSRSPSPHPTAGKISTPAASITEEDEGLNEIELKNEIGKVVIKYLSLTNQQCLWKGDKHLFKDMARKITHYIVDKEMKSGRKIKALDSNLRVKIEKFIDTFKQL